MTEWQAKCDEIDRLVSNGSPKRAVQKIEGVMEQVLRHVYGQVTAAISAKEQKKLTQRVKKIANGKPMGDMTLGQLVGIFREGKVWDLAEHALCKKLGSLKKADYDTFLDLCNRAGHKEESSLPPNCGCSSRHWGWQRRRSRRRDRLAAKPLTCGPGRKS